MLTKDLSKILHFVQNDKGMNTMLTHSKREEYGIVFVTKLAQSKDYLSLSKIAREEHIPLPFLRQIALDLRNVGIIQAVEGKNGGYTLSKKPESISVADVIEAVVKRKLLSCCNPKNDAKHVCACEGDVLWRKLNKYYIRNLYKITFDKLLT